VKREKFYRSSSSDQAVFQEVGQMHSRNEFEAIKQPLTTSPVFDVKVDNRRLIATRRRTRIPQRGIFRLLIPHVRAIVTDSAKKGLAISVQPDPIAMFMVLMLLGGVASEFLMDRVKYPRAYPPEFIYGLAVLYIGTLIVEMMYTWKQLRLLLDQVKS
jgi:hypothetical protein